MRLRALAALLFALAPAACGGSNQTADANWTSDPPEKQRNLRDVERLNATPLTDSKASTLVGVRHDLMLSNAAHPTRCSCLAAEVGQPGDARFFWTGGPQAVPPDALVIAIGARGVGCPGGSPDDTRRRPSISAVDQENDDIVVEVEDLPFDRPLASGAVIPKPGPRGAIYIRPRDRNVIYGRGGPGATACKVR